MITTSKSLDLSTNNWLQKLTSTAAVIISALTIMAAPSILYSSEQQIEENRAVVPPGAYETHLPKEIYEVCLKQHLIETDAFTSMIPQQKWDGIHRLIIRFKDEKEQYIYH